MELFFRKYGEGPPLVILHGLYGASDNWVSVARNLSDRFEVFALDQRNHGRSMHSVDHSYPAMVDDLIEFLNKQAIEKVSILGHSMGGKTAMYFASKYPERVSRLIVADISPLSYQKKVSENKRSLNHYDILAAMKSIDFSNVKSRNDVDEILAKMIKPQRVRMFLLKNLERSKNNTFAWRINVDVLYQSIDKVLEGLDPNDYSGGFGISGFPVLFIKGADSDYISEDDIVAIETIFPYSELKTIQNAGHWLHAEQADEFMNIVKSFILS